MISDLKAMHIVMKPSMMGAEAYKKTVPCGK